MGVVEQGFAQRVIDKPKPHQKRMAAAGDQAMTEVSIKKVGACHRYIMLNKAKPLSQVA